MRTCFEHFIFFYYSFAPSLIFTSVAPLLPIELIERHMSSLYAGLLTRYFSHHSSSTSVGYLLTPLAFKPLLRRCGKLKLGVSILLIQGLFISAFGVAVFFSNDSLFIIISLLTRATKTFCSIISIQTAMLMIPSYYSRTSSYFSIQIIGLQMADVVSPLWSGFLFSHLGYAGIFIALSLFPLVGALLLCYFKTYDASHPYEEPASSQSVGYLQVLRVPVSNYEGRESSWDLSASWLRKASFSLSIRFCLSNSRANSPSTRTRSGSFSSNSQSLA